MLCVLFLGLLPAQADSAASTPEQRLVFATQSARQYKFAASANRIVLHSKPLLRWDNRVVREDDGLLFLWTEEQTGRPIAAAQFFLQGPDWHHEFQSLSEKGFDVSWSADRKWSWQPDQPGIRFTAIAADAPGKTPAARLRQMRDVAERYTGAVNPEESDRFENPHELRLLTTPIYRYAAAESGVVDGAIFVYAQGTNPEVLLLLEARQAGEKTQWQRAFAPMSSFQLRVREGEQLVYERGRQKVPTLDMHDPYHFHWKAVQDDSIRLEAPK
jgi:hypothetical protein